MRRSTRTARLLTTMYDRLLAHHGPQGWWPGDGPFETIVGAILTQNTAWTNAARAIENLKAASAMSPAALRAMPEDPRWPRSFVPAAISTPRRGS